MERTAQRAAGDVTGGALVLAALRAAGTRTIYGLPGGQTLAVLDAVYHDDDVEFVATRHEMAAAHAADAHYRATGGIGVCMVTTGPGATHALSAIGGALRDRSAVLFLTCNNRREYLEEEDAQAADHVAIIRPLVKWSAQITHERAVARTIRIAVRTALTGPPGPVHVDLPRDILEATLDGGLLDAVAPALPPAAQLPDAEALDQAAALLRAAEQPVFWIGNGVALAGAGDRLVHMAERLCAPIVTTYSGIGAVPSSHPLVFGPRTRHGTQLGRSVLSQGDTLFALGMRLTSSSTHRWSASLPGVLIHSDVDEAALGRHYQPDVALPGDAGLVVDELVRRLDGVAVPASRRGWLESLEKEREDWRRRISECPPEDARGRIHPIALMNLLNDVTSPDTVYAVDAGNPGIWSHLLTVERPRSYMKPVDYGQMGFGLPAAVAAKRARPDRPVVAVVGDGSFGMSVAELETAVRERLALTVIVMNDAAYNNIRQEQVAVLGEPRHIGVDFGEVDYAVVARGFGAWGRRVSGVAETREAILGALAEPDRPAVVDVVIDPEPSVWTEPF